MIHEYALDPGSLNNWQNLRFFLSHIGFHHGRVVARYPKKWKRMVYESCRNCSDIERKRIEEALKSLKDELIPSGHRNYDSENGTSWIDNALEQHKTHPFYRIVAKNNPANHPEILISDELDDTTSGWAIQREQIIKKNAQAIASCAFSLIRHSRRVVMLDRYFSPNESRYTEPLNMILQQASDLPSPPSFEIFCMNDCLDDNWTTNINRYIRPKMPVNISLIIKRIIIEQDGERPHARYVLTEKGGLRFDYGLDTSESPSQTMDVSLLDKEVYKERWEQLVVNPIYQFEDEVMCTGNNI